MALITCPELRVQIVIRKYHQQQKAVLIAADQCQQALSALIVNQRMFIKLVLQVK